MENAKTDKSEYVLLGYSIGLFILAFINIAMAIPFDKILACAISGILISISEIADQAVCWFISLNKKDEKLQIIKHRNTYLAENRNWKTKESFDRLDKILNKHKQYWAKSVKAMKIISELVFTIAILVLIIGFAVKLFPNDEKLANALTLISLGIAFLALFGKKTMDKNLLLIDLDIDFLEDSINVLEKTRELASTEGNSDPELN